MSRLRLCDRDLVKEKQCAAGTGVNGPSHEERSVFLQVPAVTRRVHPRDLEDSLLLRKSQSVSIIEASVRDSTEANTYFVNPFQSWDLTRINLFLQPGPHPHPLYWHCDLREESSQVQQTTKPVDPPCWTEPTRPEQNLTILHPIIW